MRSYTFQCEHCPTTICVTTECPRESEAEAQAERDGELEMHPYEPTYFVGGNSRDGDYEIANLCPACGLQLHLVKSEK